jgi:hypothetical protein
MVSDSKDGIDMTNPMRSLERTPHRLHILRCRSRVDAVNNVQNSEVLAKYMSVRSRHLSWAHNEIDGTDRPRNWAEDKEGQFLFSPSYNEGGVKDAGPAQRAMSTRRGEGVCPKTAMPQTKDILHKNAWQNGATGMHVE